MALNPDEYFAIPSEEPVKRKPSTVTANTVPMTKVKTMPPKKPKRQTRKSGPVKREKMDPGDIIASEAFTWKVTKLLGSGGFGDVYKVFKKDNEDKKEFAMKTEMVQGDKRMLRLKIEVMVLKACHEIPDPEKKKHFVDFVDRGRTDKFKFLVMGLVGPSLDDIRKSYLMKNYSRATAMNASIQTMRALRDLHGIGWLHRDIKPQNYAVGLGDKEDVIYMLDFGIARKIFKADTTEVKPPRSKVKFLGTLRFASRACHNCVEQGRKDDLETWLYMAFDLIDFENGLPWKRAERNQIVALKEKFFKHGFSKVYKLVPKEFKKIVEYINQMSYSDEPDYTFIDDCLKAICKENGINPTKKLDWIGKLKKKPQMTEDSGETSSDNRQSGSDDSDSDSNIKKKKGSTLKSNRKRQSQVARKSPSRG